MGLNNYLLGSPGLFYNAKEYGCRGNGIYLNDGAITSGTAILTSATASFASTDVGKVIKVNGAGAANADFTTTILSRQSATQVTLSANASSTVTGTFVAYGTDDTIALQVLINTVFSSATKSGTIFFPDGIYIINGALQTSVSGENPNCQIYLPVLDNTVTALPAIRFLGETPPFPANSRKVGAVVLNDGAILHSTLTAVSGTLPAMFGGCNTTVAINNATFIRGSFENIHVRVCSHALVAGPVLTGINAARWQALSCDDVVIDADCVSHASLAVKPVNEAAGVIYPQINTSNNLSSKNLYVSYFKYNIVLGELMTLVSAISVTGNYAYVFTNGNYPALGGHLRVTHCTNAVLVASSAIFSAYDGPTVFDIQELDVEVETAGGNWQDGVTALTDVDNNGFGKITYSYVDSTPHTQMVFNKIGGTGVYTNLIGTLGNCTAGADTSAFNLIFNSTLHTTKGLIAFGSTTGMVYDETNKRLGVGKTPASHPLEVTTSVNGSARIEIENTNSGTAAQPQLAVKNNTGLVVAMSVKSSGFTTSGLVKANQTTLISNATDSFLLGSSTSVPLIFLYGGTGTGNASGQIDGTGLSFQVLLKTLTFSAATNKMCGQATLVAGTIAITITGLTTSHRAFVQLVTANTTALTVQYQAVCTANTLTIQANVAAGTINTADVSTLNYVIFLNN